MSYALFLASCAVLFVVPLAFVLHDVYEDGVIGRGALLSISFCAAAFIGEAAFGVAFYMPPPAVALVASFAVFLVWHLFRFHRRVLKKRSSGIAIQ